jgi:hypothetical protein
VNGQTLVASEQKVIATVSSRSGCTRKSAYDTAHAYAFSIPNAAAGREQLFFIPRGISGHYTQDQFSLIEKTLAYFGLDLLPLN